MESWLDVLCHIKCNTGIYTEVPTFVLSKITAFVLFLSGHMTLMLQSSSFQMVSFEQPSGSSVEERLHQDEARVSVSISLHILRLLEQIFW